MSLFAGDIKIDPGLRAQLGANSSLGDRQKNSISGLYDRMRGNFNADAAARGAPAGSYAGSRLGTGEDLALQNLQTTLEGVLGDTAYQDYKAQRGYDENAALAKEIGMLNKPGEFEMLLSALGSATKIGGSIYGASGSGGGGMSRQGQSYGSIKKPSYDMGYGGFA